jgi:alkylresorcinol/alkylpyrone synthase
MATKVLGMGVAVPKHQMTQAESLQMFQAIVCEDERQARLATVLFRKSEVQTRYTVLPHKVAYNWCQPSDTAADSSVSPDRAIPSEVIPQVMAGKSCGPTTRERMELYARFASDLAVEAAGNALQDAGVSAAQITHLVVVTCTGFDAPGVDLELIERLALPRTTQRVQVGFMGCHGAINGIRTALALAGSNPGAQVLLCAIELCSLHYRFTWDAEGIIGNALFADGSGALVIGADSTDRGEAALDGEGQGAGQWQIEDTGSVVIRDSRQAMSWSVGDHGFDMRLTSDVGDKIEGDLAGWLTDWLAQHQLTLADITYWGVHPGGPRILSAVQNSLDLDPAALSVSRGVLQRHGNMSSPTVLFILNEFRQMRSTRGNGGVEYCVLLGFGPGLVAEIALLRVA